MRQILATLCFISTVLADGPPPIPGGAVSVFSPGELIIIDSYPSNRHAAVAKAIANATPLPPLSLPPVFPSSVIASTNQAGTITLTPPPPEFEWELTFEWVPELGSTNIVVYPIKIQVPFEHAEGFVYIRARKVAE